MLKIIGIEDATYTKKGATFPTIATRLYISGYPCQIGEKVSEVFIPNRGNTEFHLGEITTVLYEPGYGGNMRATGVLYAPENSSEKNRR